MSSHKYGTNPKLCSEAISQLNLRNDELDLPLCRLGEHALDSTRPDLLENLAFRVITEPGQWLNTAYELLAEQFDPEVLDPLERYVAWIELNRAKKHPFPYLLMVAYSRVQGRAVLLGAISANIMKVEEYVGANALRNLYIFAIGHQVTDLALRKNGVKGVGTKLWESAIREAGAWIKDLDGEFCYSVLEAENDSVGFWGKMGHLWPKGVPYWQPPLEFDDSGQYVYPEVPEILMLCPMDGVPKRAVEKKLLQNIIATMYLNWSLDKYRRVLSPDAMRKAENYVMERLFGRICAEMPDTNTVPLVPFAASEQK